MVILLYLNFGRVLTAADDVIAAGQRDGAFVHDRFGGDVARVIERYAGDGERDHAE